MTPFHPYPLSRRTLLMSAAALPAVAASGSATALVQSALPATPPPDASIPELVAGNTTFAFELYAKLRDTVKGNLLVSPFSISQALAMTYAGACGATATQMEDVLSFTLPQPQLHDAFSALNADLVARGNADAGGATAEEARSLRIANSVWIEQTYPLVPAYITLLDRYYGSALNEADFKNAPEETREEINTWVEDQTEDRIQDVVTEGAIDRGTKLVLVNAIYFYGSWQHAFDPDDTRDDAFHLLDGSNVTVPFMYTVAELPYAWGEDYQAIEFPYTDSSFALTMILPDEGRFVDVESRLDGDMLAAAFAQLSETEVHVYLPKFALVFGTIELNDTLQSLGMVDAFDPMCADFTGAAEEGLFITHVLHKAFIGVDEQGTEAAAATVVIFGSPIAMPPIEVRIDRPFLFAIRDTVTGTILFIGRVMEPGG